MKVALVTNAYAPTRGGLETYLRALASGLVAAGDDVEVCTQTSDPNLARHERLPDGVVVRRFRTPARPRHYAFAPALVTHLRHHGSSYDVVHAHGYHALPALVAARFGRPLVFTPHFHGTSASPIRALLHVPYRRIGRYIFGRSQRVICISATEAALVTRVFPDTASRVDVIPHGVAAPANAPAFAVAGRVVLTVGRIEDYKRIDRLIGAMRHLPPCYRLVVVGDGPDRTRLERIAAPGRGRVVFTGRVDDHELDRWYATAAVYATCSELEAFGLTLVEAAGAGVPLVASDIPAHREVVELIDRDSVLVAPNCSPPELAAALLAADSGRRAPPTTLDTWSQVVTDTRAVYQAVR